MKCPSCAKEINDGLKFCPKCGVHIPSAAGRKKTSAEEQPVQRKQRKLDAAKSARLWKIFIYLTISPFILYFILLGVKTYLLEKSFKDCQVYQRTGRYEQGVEVCEKALARKPNRVDTWIELAKCYRGLDDFENILSTTSKGLKLAGDHPELYALKGEVLYHKDNFKQARAALEKALKLDPQNKMANQYFGYILVVDEEKEAAVDHLLKALEGAGRSERIEINDVLGDIYSDLGQYRKAVDHYINVKEMEMNDVDLCLKLADALLSSHLLDESVKEAERCVGIAPDNREVIDLKTKIILKKERIDTVKYIVERKELDDVLQIMYQALQNHIESINFDPDAFFGQPDPELDSLIQDTEALLESYRKIRAPESYYIMHSETLNATTTILDTMKLLLRYVKSADPQHSITLEQYMEASQKRMTNLMEIWDREYTHLDIKALMAEAKAMENATGSVELTPQENKEPEKTDGPDLSEPREIAPEDADPEDSDTQEH